MINFPWRFLELTTLGLSCFIGVSLVYTRRLRYVLAVLLVGGAVYLYWPYSKIISYKYSATDTEYRSMLKTNTGYTPDTEYLPKGINYISLLEERGKAETLPLLEPVSGTMSFNSTQRNNLTITSEATVVKSGVVRVQQFNFPGWEVRTNNKPIPIVSDKYGLITFVLSPGVHVIEIAFHNTPIRTIANGM